ncbi:LytR/AlgR family response regulator transcription factor [Enterococcus sp. AZ163]|uniref:LytR/AlgR family response regulator transcription factor n=1 Tax=Enterococcus sp. AZ163 TaxID=2774638 RepID=UPI003D2D52F6
MIKIGVCDDDLKIIEEIHAILSSLAVSHNLDFKLYFFETGESLLAFYKTNHLDILLLDIELDGADGMDIASCIRNSFQDQIVKIIFVSSHSDYVFKSFDVSAFHFLVKPINHKKLVDLIMKLYEKLTRVNKDDLIVFKLKSTSEKQIVRKGQIISLELVDSPKRWIVLKTIDHTYDVTGRLTSYWEELVNNDFFKIYRSIIINLNYLNKISNDKVIMEGGDEFPLSRKYKKELTEKYSKFMINTYSKKRDLE